MLRNDRTRKQDVLENHIKAMAEKLLEKNDFKKIASDLRDDVYNDDFEHCDPELFTLISEMFKEDDKYTLDFLSLNVLDLRDYIEEDCESGCSEFICIAGHVDKLCDYINLEIGRLNYYLIDNNKIKDLETKISDVNSSVNETTNKVETINKISDDVKEKVQKANKGIEKANRGIKKANQQASKMQAQMATILGIFAAIVIAFSAGLTVLGNSISAIGQAKYPESIVLALIICGIIIFDSLSYLMYMISRIIDRNILIGCKARSCAECNDNDKCMWGTRVRKRFPYLFYFNLFAGLGIIVDMVVWLLDIRGFIG